MLVKKNSKILDLGCGPGYLTKYLNAKYYLGIDNSEKYISLAKKKYERKNLKFIKKDIINLNYSGYNRFNYVTIIGTLHHLSDYEIKKLIKNLSKLPKKTKIITFDGYRSKKDNFIKKFLYNNDRGKFIRHEDKYRKLFPIKKFYIETYKKEYFFYNFICFKLSRK